MDLWRLLSIVADIVSIVGIAITLVQIIKTRADTQRIRKELEYDRSRKTRTITIILEQTPTSEDEPPRRNILPFTLRRSDLTRGEVLGRLSMAQVNQAARFNLKYLQDKAFLERINVIADGEDDETLVIPVNKDEYDRFVSFE
jgi:hypothetical protein